MKKLAIELGKKLIKLPSFIIAAFMHFIRKSIKKQANFDIKDLDIIKYAQKCTCPIQFVVSKEDTYVKSEHTLKLYNSYNKLQNQKRLKYVDGEHNAFRDDNFYWEMTSFFVELEKSINPGFNRLSSINRQKTIDSSNIDNYKNSTSDYQVDRNSDRSIESIDDQTADNILKNSKQLGTQEQGLLEHQIDQNIKLKQVPEILLNTNDLIQNIHMYQSATPKSICQS